MYKLKLLLSFIVAITLSACTASGVRDAHEKTVYAMDTVMKLTAYGDNAGEAIKAAETEIFRLERLFSRDSGTGEVYRINKNKYAQVSEDTAEIIKKALGISEATGGAFDISVAPLTDLWGFYTKDYYVPSQNEIGGVLPKIDYRNISVNGNSVSVSGDSEIDLGGIAKGFLAERIINIYRMHGVSSGIVSLGGNVQTLGNKPDGSKWRVAVQDPDADDSYIGVLSVSDTAVVTSGGYRRCFESGGKIYHHILDPKTGYPVENGLKSVTVVCPDGTKADALSTALFVMGLDAGTEYWRAGTDFEAIFLTEDDSVYITAGLENIFESDHKIQIISEQC